MTHLKIKVSYILQEICNVNQNLLNADHVLITKYITHVYSPVPEKH